MHICDMLTSSRKHGADWITHAPVSVIDAHPLRTLPR